MVRERHMSDAGRPSEERTKQIFSTIAPEYDRFNKYSSMGLDRLWRKATVRLSRLKRSSEVLDLAAGTGDLTLAFAEQGGPARILCTDLVPEMLEVARAKVAAYEGSTKIEFEVVDAQALPMPDASFDVVTVGFGVRNMPDRAANFREVYRVLRPGGRYVVLEFSRPLFPPFRGLYHFYLRTVIPMLGEKLTADRGSFEYLNESILAFPGQVALAGELHKAGFSEVTWRNLTFGIVAVHVAVK
ncbi:MAG: bifunctional demethylmenaquinone methyltransferase/2-methoxy-6-polyprenyl-1,4-benzoquinol methylase UbiE [Coriobacteriia bacterium]|nr:bifunctional demethylmenaquinone methyltransferase/2-methoxy-6-polyprenyl-1,4-benzoquinol methylase UbiE [Coriobacteriia bacterium]